MKLHRLGSQAKPAPALFVSSFKIYINSLRGPSAELRWVLVIIVRWSLWAGRRHNHSQMLSVGEGRPRVWEERQHNHPQLLSWHKLLPHPAMSTVFTSEFWCQDVDRAELSAELVKVIAGIHARQAAQRFAVVKCDPTRVEPT